MPKIVFRKCDISSTGFSGHYTTQKEWRCLGNFKCVIVIYILINIFVWGQFNNLILIGIYYRKPKCFWKPRLEIFKHPKLLFFGRANFIFLPSITFYIVHFLSFHTFACFWPKMSKHDAAYTSFCRKIISKFCFDILMKYVKIMLNKALKFSGRCLPWVLSYWISGRGQPPPQRGDARITRIPSLIVKINITY